MSSQRSAIIVSMVVSRIAASQMATSQMTVPGDSIIEEAPQTAKPPG